MPKKQKQQAIEQNQVTKTRKTKPSRVNVIGTNPSSCPCGHTLLNGLCYNCPDGFTISGPGICSKPIKIVEPFESIDFSPINFIIALICFIIIYTI